MVRVVCLILALWSVIIFPTAVLGKSESHEMFHYTWRGGLAQYSPQEIVIRADGSGVVTLGTRSGRKTTDIKLNDDELSVLKKAIGSTNFFSLPVCGGGAALDAGETTIKICLGDKVHEVSGVHWSALRPLEEFADKLIAQAGAIYELETDGNVLQAKCAVDPSLVGSKALQPRALEKPLKDYIHNATNSSKLSMVVEALAFVLTPNEFSEFLASELDQTDITHRILLLNIVTVYSFTAKIGEENDEALKTVLAKVLKEDYGRYDSLSKDHRRALDNIIAPILWVRAVPILLESNPARYTQHDCFTLPVIKNKGEGLKSVFPLLNSNKPEVRATAAWLFGEIFTWIPDYIADCEDATLADKDAVAEYIRITVRPVLIELTQKDPDERVSKAAGLSLQQIEKGWKEK